MTCCRHGSNYADQRIKTWQNDFVVVEFTKFLRFDEVNLWYCSWYKPIEEKCRLSVALVESIKESLYHSSMIEFTSMVIDRTDRSAFSDHSQLLNYLRDEFLPSCYSLRGYKFEFFFHSDNNAGANVIASILQMDRIYCCSNVEITLYGNAGQLELPIETISSWLHRKSSYGIVNEKQKGRSVKIWLRNIQNALELCDHLKKVINIIYC